MGFVYSQSRISPLHTPQLGGGHAVIEAQNSAVTGSQNSVPSPLSPQRKLRPPKRNMKHYKSVKLAGTVKEKYLYITVALAPFESNVFTHYSCCCGPL